MRLSCLLLIQALLLCGVAWLTSLNRTETGHLGAAVYLYETFRFDVFHVNPPLTRYFVGLPIRLADPDYDWKSYSPRPQDRSEWQIGTAFINANPPENIQWCVFLARCSLIPLILLGSYFGYKFANELYGVPAGLVFLALWTFSPLILGWGATLCPDVVAASLGIIACYNYWHWLKNPTWWNVCLAGFALGLLPLAKLTWIIAFPIWLLIWCVWTFFDFRFCGRSVKQFATIILLAIYVINMGYGFDGSFRLLKDYKFISHTLRGVAQTGSARIVKAENRFNGTLLGYIPMPLPAEFVQGIDTQKLDFERGIESYFLGEYSQHGWFTYYNYVLLVKEPLGFWCLAILTLVVSCFMWRYNSDIRNEFTIIFPGVVLFIFMSSQSGFSIHPRYIIVVLPFLYLWVSKLGKAFTLKNKGIAAIVSVSIIWFITSSLLWYPHSMSYFNELVRSPIHGKYFSDKNPPPLLGSNIDWDQNTYFFKTWYDKHESLRPIFVTYGGISTLEKLGVVVESPPKELVIGYYAIGINELFGSSNQYEKFRSMTPIAIIGYSIYIYHITPEMLPVLKSQESD